MKNKYNLSMDILVLEDDPIRQKIFSEKLIGSSFVIVSTAKEAIKKLAEKNWDYAFLDHDLGGEIYVESGEGTGYEVAEWLAAHPEHHPRFVIIHSFNPAGAQKMQDVLPKATLAPGCWKSLQISQ